MEDNVINNKLENLVGARFTEEELNAFLSKIFDCKVEVDKYEREECVKKDLPDLDDQFLFPIENEKIDLFIDVDLYYLIDNGGNYYITETCFNHQ